MRRLEDARALSVAAWTATLILLALAAWFLSRADTPPAYGRGLIGGESAAIHFEDIAARAGLTAVNVNGGDKAKRYILRSEERRVGKEWKSWGGGDHQKEKLNEHELA